MTHSMFFAFSAKEKDAETGLSYFGSRYYSSDLSLWLSVDPMSDKYPSLSPYAYCNNNPILIKDPNGEDGVITIKLQFLLMYTCMAKVQPVQLQIKCKLM